VWFLSIAENTKQKTWAKPSVSVFERLKQRFYSAAIMSNRKQGRADVASEEAASLITQRLHGIHARRASRRDIARCQRYHSQYRGYAGERGGIGGRNGEQQAGH
jgi:hypothetical protein